MYLYDVAPPKIWPWQQTVRNVADAIFGFAEQAKTRYSNLRIVAFPAKRFPGIDSRNSLVFYVLALLKRAPILVSYAL